MPVWNEDMRVKFPATIQFLRLGYRYQSLRDADIDTDTRIFVNCLKAAVEKINNCELNDDEVIGLVSELHELIKYNDMGQAFYKRLVIPQARLKLIDFDNIENNDFAVVDELFFGPEEKGSFRPDINILINGIPLGFLEVKKPNNEGGIQAEFKRMLDKRLRVPEYKKYFNMLQFVTFSNNMEYESDDDAVSPEEIRAGSFYTTPNGQRTSFSFFREERPKRTGFEDVSIEKMKYILKDNRYRPSEVETSEFQMNLDINTPCNRFVTSFFDKPRLMYMLQYGITYVDGKVPEKHIMRYPQFFASQAIVKRLENGGKSGIIFHTQGSGKTELSAFSVRILRDYYAAKGITARFFYVVDRLELLTQVSGEMHKRGLNVINVNSRSEFENELNKAISTSMNMDSIGEITVVNIQKFNDNLPQGKNDYNAKIQRVFFIDEAHRSYRMTGEFFKNLMLADQDAVYIAMTGTPLLSKKERSNLKFGDYIHKYFYDKSIADGYTLRIKKEDIDTTARAEIRKNLQLDKPDVDKRDMKLDPNYINALGKFIDKDFNYFRLTNADTTIGGMIVCASNPQAKLLKQWFDEHSELTTGIVITDENIPNAVKKKTQLSFKETLQPDMLIVHQMLTTGYDVNRLKKMYLLRNAREHTLLQTISRVNRPYKSPTGKVYEFGYIVDFVDIAEEYDRTIEMYLKEMEDDFSDDGDGGSSLTGLVVGPEDINRKYLKLKAEVDGIVDTSNLERFSKMLTYFNRETLLKLRHYLNGIKTCHTEFLLSRAEEYAAQIDVEAIKKLSRELQNRIDFVNLSTKPTDILSIVSNKEVVEIIYEFFKVRISILDLGKLGEAFKKLVDSEDYKKLEKNITDIQYEVQRNRNKNQSEMVMLDELLKQIFAELNVIDVSNLAEVNGKLAEILAKIKQINAENEALAARYDGSYAFVKTFSDAKEMHPDLDKEDIAKVVDVVYAAVKDIQDANILILQGREVFIASVKKSTVAALLKAGLYKKLTLKDWYSDLLQEAYANMKIF